MPKYKCTNSSCELYDIVKHESAKLRTVDGKVRDTSLPCPSCKEDREELKEEFKGFTTYIHGGPNISRR